VKQARVVLAAVAAASAAFVMAIGFERELVRLLSLDLGELEWVSDVVLSTALGVATFLWLHLRRARTELTRLERAQLVLDTELRIASEIQQHLLPPLPVARDGWCFAARLEPAGRVGGDFYDFVDLGGSLLVLLADVSGKGIPAALVIGSCRTLFRQLARETHEPSRLVARLGRALLDEHGGAPYLTCFLGRIDLGERSLSWVNAGHPAGLVVAGGEHRALSATGPPAGLLPDVRYEARSQRLAAGEALLLVTDGVTEALDGDGPIDERLARAVSRKRASGAQAICEQVMRLSRAGPALSSGANGTDDRTVVVVTLEAA
jgi:sigma-B regulation protein RsbU (phosphoserine phosphatase)